MKSAGPWNLRGLRPEARAAARESARRSGMSVGEWLNTVIQPAEDEEAGWWSNEYDREPDERVRPRHAERDRYRDAPPPRRSSRERYEEEPSVQRRPRPPREDYPSSGGPYRSGHGRGGEPRREQLRPSDYAPAVGRAEGGRDATVDNAIAEIEARQRDLDAGGGAAAGIQGRQHAHDSDAAPQRSFSEREPQPFPSAPEQSYASYPAEPAFDVSGLEHQLREITARIETLQSTGDLSTALNELRSDLAEIGRMITEALPRRALESLEIEVKALAERIDHSRQSGADMSALGGIERGLAEVREALHQLTPAESLAGFHEAVNALSTRLDTIVAREDPATLQQLEAAIGGLRGIVSHVASNDTLTKVADDVRALAAKVDGLANSSTGAPQLTALESRIEMLAGAINASNEAGHAVPRELEKLLSGLIEKLEWVQLTHTDHTALAHLEDRIAALVKRLDVSDARLGLLEGVERGLADLLVYIEQLRGGGAAVMPAVAPRTSPAPVNAIEQEVAEIKQTERRTQDSLEDMLGTVEHVVDRLAMIESDMRGDKQEPAPAEPVSEEAEPSPVTLVPEQQPDEAAAMMADAEADAQAQDQEQEPEGLPSLPSPQQRHTAAARMPIDPSLPPDHPLEPGSAGRARGPSAAERIAASEAAIGSKPPVIPDPGGGKPDFIGAARRAAKAAALSAAAEKSGAKAVTSNGAASKKLSERIRTLAVAAAVVVIIVGGFHIVSRLFEDGGSNPAPQTRTAPSPRALTEPLPLQPEPKPVPEPPHVQIETPPAAATNAAPASGPEIIQVPPAAGDAAPSPGAAPPNAAMPAGHQSSLGPVPDTAQGETAIAGVAVALPTDITGSLPKGSAPQGTATVAAPGASDKLPVAIGTPALRNAAIAGDPYAAYELGVRFAEGRVVPINNEEAARWFDIAAKKGLAPAEFRLGALYEKGLGVKKDLVAARDLYRAAADKGHGKAMHNLAVLYAEGVDGRADYHAAAQWFHKAADRGVADSQYNLAVLYARGVGVEQNFAESYKWFLLAAKDGDKDAAQKRDEVATHLDPAALEKARHAAEQWKPQAQPADVTVKGAWDAPSSPAPAKTKARSTVKAPAADAAKVN